MSNYVFYRDRINACPLYGFSGGHQILDMVISCALTDFSLTGDERNSIIKQADDCHIKMMEDNYNEGWS